MSSKSYLKCVVLIKYSFLCWHVSRSSLLLFISRTHPFVVDIWKTEITLPDLWLFEQYGCSLFPCTRADSCVDQFDTVIPPTVKDSPWRPTQRLLSMDLYPLKCCLPFCALTGCWDWSDFFNAQAWYMEVPSPHATIFRSYRSRSKGIQGIPFENRVGS